MLKAKKQKKRINDLISKYLRLLDPQQLHIFTYLLRNVPTHYPLKKDGKVMQIFYENVKYNTILW